MFVNYFLFYLSLCKLLLFCNTFKTYFAICKKYVEKKKPASLIIIRYDNICWFNNLFFVTVFFVYFVLATLRKYIYNVYTSLNL